MAGDLIQLIADDELDLAVSEPELAGLVAEVIGPADPDLRAGAQDESAAIAGFGAGAAASADLEGSLTPVIAAASEVVQTPLEVETQQLGENIAAGTAILQEVEPLGDEQPLIFGRPTPVPTPAPGPGTGGGGVGGGGGGGGPAGGGQGGTDVGGVHRL